MGQSEKCEILETRTKDATYEIINESDIAYYASTLDGTSEQSLDLSIPDSLPFLDANTRPLADSLELFQDLSPPDSPSRSDDITRWLAKAEEEYLDLSQPGSPPTIVKNTPAPPASLHPDLEEDIQDTAEICSTTDDPIPSRDVDEDEAPMDLMDALVVRVRDLRARACGHGRRSSEIITQLERESRVSI